MSVRQAVHCRYLLVSITFRWMGVHLSALAIPIAEDIWETHSSDVDKKTSISKPSFHSDRTHTEDKADKAKYHTVTYIDFRMALKRQANIKVTSWRVLE